MTKDKGRGIFALRDFRKGELVEKSPVQPFSLADKKKILKTSLKNYYIESDDGKFNCIMFGYGSIFNHSSDPNAKVDFDKAKKNVIFKTIKNIKKGEEITFNYNGDSKKNLLSFKATP